MKKEKKDKKSKKDKTDKKNKKDKKGGTGASTDLHPSHDKARDPQATGKKRKHKHKKARSEDAAVGAGKERATDDLPASSKRHKRKHKKSRSKGAAPDGAPLFEASHSSGAPGSATPDDSPVHVSIDEDEDADEEDYSVASTLVRIGATPFSMPTPFAMATPHFGNSFAATSLFGAPLFGATPARVNDAFTPVGLGHDVSVSGLDWYEQPRTAHA